ncbi:hypothetical protein TcasGA2_TC032287 [Tribolium castaneum]|uniref:U1-type domain-containing protein n=2 Tax=Tribolium castaneum TaxID=7070 RepID=A0A139WLX3_TRICA|nr:hypothetical protein TcasGA2_TC032287 [Tribolium castaneum]
MRGVFSNSKYSYSQTAAMTRGRGYSPRGYRGGSGRGSWGGGRGGYHSRGGGRNFDSSFSDSFDSRSKYGGSSDRYSGSRGHGHGHDDFRKSYRMDSGYSGRDSGHRSPDRKRPRNEAPSSRHDSSYGGYGSSTSRYDSSYSDRRSFSSDRHPGSFSRRDDFRRPSGPPRGGYRGRISSRGSRGLKLRDRPTRRRLVESSYAVRKRIIPSRTSDYARKLKISKMRSAIAARKKRASDKEDSDEEKEEKDEKNEEEEEEDKNENNEGVEEDKKPTNKEEISDKEDKGEKGDEPAMRKTFIKLNCPHCGIKAVTFRKYDLHLQSRTHMMAMRKVAIKQKSILAQMRQAQRNAQNELEKTSDDLAPRTNFCPLCKLNYKQRKAVHQNSDAHKNMKKFLMPYCKLCSITFKSPMMYESHCCSIEHLKRKQRVENGENSDEFDDEANLENFTTIDSVGNDGDVSEEDDKKDTNKEPVNVGIEQIRKVEAYYCDLCKMYVGRGSDDMITPILARHCKQRTHMQRYIRYKEDKDLEKRAEKLQRKETAEKEGKEKQVKENTEETTPKNKKEEQETEKDDESASKVLDDEEARDDKLWADVDKDLDDILAKEGTKSSDEDEDVNGERYDRFKYSEKNGEEKVVKEGEGGEAVAAEVKVAEVTAEK